MTPDRDAAPAPDADPERHESTLVLTYDSEREARVVAESVAREVGDIDDDRSRTTLSRDGATVTLRVSARDLTALRAGQNTWLSLVGVAEAAVDAGDRFA